MPVTLTFHDSQYPARLAEQVCQGLRARKLPGKLLYESPAQAQRWLAYHQAYSPSRTEPALLALYDQAFQAALQALSPSALHYVSLGCGGGTKDAQFLQQAVRRCPDIRSLLRPGDMLLLSANLSPGLYADAVARILPQYDNPLARAWYAGLLDSLGFTAAQLQLTVSSHLLQPDGHIWQIRAEATVQHQMHLTVHNDTFTFTAGESIEVFFSNRFTPQIMPQVLTDAGLTLLQTWLFDSQEEAIYLCARA
jgi:uncharacterized SAM-dependent methyltransferase